jgi:hypothetical protein
MSSARAAARRVLAWRGASTRGRRFRDAQARSHRTARARLLRCATLRTATDWRLGGLVLLGIAALGWLMTLEDTLGSAQCFREAEFIMMLCAGPPEPWQVASWLVVTLAGIVAVTRARVSDPRP